MPRDQDAITLWIYRNRGTVAAVAKAAGVTPQFVSMVLRGHRKSEHGKVERKLRESGAPI
jgi:uncharacterized protein YbjT (DUF2867 family)